MPPAAPKLVSKQRLRAHLLLLGSLLSLLTGMALAWHRGQVLTPVVSFLLSRRLNPAGNFSAALGLTASALFLWTSVACLRASLPRRLLLTGSIGLTLVGVLGFLTDSLGPFHDALTTAVLAALLLGIVTSLTAHRRKHPQLPALLLFLLVTIALLMSAYAHPRYFDASHWWRNLAVAEWTLIFLLFACLQLVLSLELEDIDLEEK